MLTLTGLPYLHCITVKIFRIADPEKKPLMIDKYYPIAQNVIAIAWVYTIGTILPLLQVSYQYSFRLL
jgi:hypothetical protein